MSCSCGRTRWAWWRAKVGNRLLLSSFLLSFLPSLLNHSCNICSVDCRREDFLSSNLYDSNFDTSNLQNTYAHSKEVRVYCTMGYTGFFKLVCNNGVWSSKGKPCQRKLSRGLLHHILAILSFKISLGWQQHVLYLYSAMLSNFLWSPWRCPVRRLPSGGGRRFSLWIQSRLHLQQRVWVHLYAVIFK